MVRRVLLAALVCVCPSLAQDIIGKEPGAEAAGALELRLGELRRQNEPSPALARTLNDLGVVRFGASDVSRAETLLEESVKVWDAVAPPEYPDRLTAVVNLARTRIAAGKLDEAARDLFEARRLLENTRPEDHGRMGAVLNNLGLVHDQRGDAAGAIAFYRDAARRFGRMGTAGDPLRARALSNLGQMLAEAGQSGAEEAAREAVALLEKARGTDDSDTALAHYSLGLVLRVRGDLGAAAGLYEKALRTWRKALGEDHLCTAMAEAALGDVYAQKEWFGRAEPLLRRALATRLRTMGSSHRETAGARALLGAMLVRAGRHSEAEELLQSALAGMEATAGAAHPDSLKIRFNLAAAEFRQGPYDKQKYREAEANLRRLIALQEGGAGRGSAVLLRALDALADVCAAQGRYHDAGEAEGKALAIRRVQLGPEHPDTVSSLRRYTRFLGRK